MTLVIMQSSYIPFSQVDATLYWWVISIRSSTWSACYVTPLRKMLSHDMLANTWNLLKPMIQKNINIEYEVDYLLIRQLLRLQSTAAHFYKRRGDVYRFGVRERPPLPSAPPTHFITSSENYYSHLVLMGWLLLEKLLWNKSPLIQDEGDTLM